MNLTPLISLQTPIVGARKYVRRKKVKAKIPVITWTARKGLYHFFKFLK